MKVVLKVVKMVVDLVVQTAELLAVGWVVLMAAL